MSVSIVIPYFNEIECLPALVEELTGVLVGLDTGWDVVFVDDGSLDGSFELLSHLIGEEKRFKIVRFRRNFGQTAALAAGIEAASGDVVICMDADLQNDPADIPLLLQHLTEGVDVVSGWRHRRRDRWISRRLPSILANRLISRITGVRLHDYGCTLKAYRREVLENVRLYGEMHRFIPALAHQSGARVIEVKVNHRARSAGTSKYGIDRTLRVVLDLLTVKFLLTYATRPLQLFGKWGVGAIGLSGLFGLVTLSMKWSEGLGLNRNPLTILAAFLFFTGLQLIGLGLVGELMTRTYHEAQDKPVYTIRETVNLEP